MPDVFLHIVGPLRTDPELETGDILTLERSDGRRGVWRQRLRMVRIVAYDIYIMTPVESTDG